MKNILYDKIVGEEEKEYNKFVSYITDTGKVQYDFKYEEIPYDILATNVSKLRKYVKTDFNVALYGKSGYPEYTTSIWEVLVGNFDSKKYYVPRKFSWMSNSESYVVAPDGSKINYSLFWATIASGFTSHSGLGGLTDFITRFASDLSTNPDASFPSGSFDAPEWNAIADGYNVLNMNRADLVSSMELYYSEDFSEKTRVDYFIERNSSISERYKKDLDHETMEKYNMTSYPGCTSETLKLAFSKIQSYIAKNK